MRGYLKLWIVGFFVVCSLETQAAPSKAFQNLCGLGLSCLVSLGGGCAIGYDHARPVTLRDQRELTELLQHHEISFERPSTLYFIPQIHSIGALSDAFPLQGTDELWAVIQARDPAPEDTVRSQLAIYHYLRDRDVKFVFDEGQTDLRTNKLFIDVAKIDQFVDRYGLDSLRSRIKPDAFEIYARLRLTRQELHDLPRDYDQLSAAQKGILYFGAAEALLMQTELLAILPTEDQSLNDKAIQSITRPSLGAFLTAGGSHSHFVFERREILALALVAQSMGDLDVDEAYLIFGAGHHFEDYQIENLNIIRLDELDPRR